MTRQGSDGDRRRVMHVLTDTGRKVLEAADAAIEARLETLAGELSEPEGRQRVQGTRRRGGKRWTRTGPSRSVRPDNGAEDRMKATRA